MLACKNHPINYLTVPKAACTTIKNIMYMADTGQQFENPLMIHQSDALLKVKDGSDLYFERLRKPRIFFTFVREPAARVYSCFNEKIWADHPYAFPGIRRRIRKLFGYHSPTSPDYSPELHGKNFAGFLKFIHLNLSGHTDTEIDGHWNLQHTLIFGRKRMVVPDFIGRSESFAAGMKLVLDYAQCERPIDLSIRHNEGPRAPYSLAEVLNNESRALIGDIYEKDFTKFGYDPSVLEEGCKPGLTRAGILPADVRSL